MDDNNLDNKWTLRDLPRIAWGNIKELWPDDFGMDRTMAKEMALIFLVACAVWLMVAGLFYVGTMVLGGGE